jgi:predicted Rossmann fold flavoprotein
VSKAKIATQKPVENIFDVVIIGGGPAGLMAACTAGASGAKVLLLEKNDELGKKLLISGGGRCNMTNANPNQREFVSKFGKKGNFLFTPLSIFGVEKTIKFFNDLGLKTKIEPGFRVFPESDNSVDVLDVLVNQAKKLGVEFKMSAEVISLTPSLDKEGARGQLKNQKRISSVLLKTGEEVLAHKFIPCVEIKLYTKNLFAHSCSDVCSSPYSYIISTINKRTRKKKKRKNKRS